MTAQREILIDGERAACLSADDRGLQYGDGVFRTLRVVGGQPRWWDEQIAKLTEDAVRLGLTAPDADVWEADLAQMALGGHDGIIKLVLTRGSGPRGYSPPVNVDVRRICYFDAVAPAPTPSDGLTLRICNLRLGWQPSLAGIKHLNRLENVLARAEWSSPEIHEGILLDQADNAISGVMSNLFVWRDQRLLTPQLDRCGVAGVARARLMRLARAHGIEVFETNLNLQALFDAEEVMVSNSVMGLRRVARLEDQSWPGPLISKQLGAWLDA